MSTYTATSTVETLTGTTGSDNFNINRQTYINAGDVYDGGDGTDILWLTKTMMGIDMPGNLDFRQVSIFNMEVVAFNYMKMAMPGQAIFNADQFGTGLLSNNLEVRGAWGNTDITVYLGSGDTSFSAAGWTFPNTATVNSTSSQAMGTPTPAGDAYSAWGAYIYTGTSSMMVTTGQEVGGTDTIHLIGSDGANTITGSSQTDIITGGLGADVLDGGAGTDSADYSAMSGGISVTLNGATAVTVTVSGGDNDSIKNFENVTGGSGNDTITGDGSANILSGGAGNDSLVGGSGSDTLIGGLGVDTLDGGAGTGDVADYSAMTGDLSITLTGAAASIVAVAGGDSDSVVNVEHIYGGSGNDSITGDTMANTIRGGAGADVLDGGGNNDTLDYTGMSNGITLTLNGAADATVTVTGGQNDVIRNFENVTGGSGNDVITGDAGANVLKGGAGTNTLNGSDGNDILYADYGVENLQGGSGNDSFYINRQTHLNTGDVIDGGDGTDVIWAGKGMMDYEENFNFSNVSFTSIEGLYFNYMGMSMPGTATFSSAQFGSGLSNTLEVRGSWGNNDITVNLVTGNTNLDASGWTFPTANGTTSGTSTYAWGHYTYTGSGMNNGLDVGGTDTIHLNGSAGDNTITGTVKDDIIDGAGGNDTVVFSGNRSDYTITQNGSEFTIADNRTSGTGTDKVTTTEHFQFADGSYTASQLLSGDNTSPTVIITGGPVNGSSTSATTAVVAWSGNDAGGTGIDHYLYSTDNGATWTSTTATSVTLTGLTDGLKSFQVKAVDGVGNEGPAASEGWTVDTVVPTISITGGPANGSSTSSTSATLTWSGNDGTGSGVDHYLYSTDDGATWTSTTDTSVTLTGLTNGPQTFEVKSVDEAGNESSVATGNWSVDTLAPTVTITNGPLSGVRTNLTSATISWTASDGDGAGVDHYQYSTDGGMTWTVLASTSVTLSGLADGTQTFDLQAVDGDGNVSDIASRSWTIDSSVPYQASASIDNLVGTDGDEDFITNKQTYLNAGDVLDGGAGTDTLWAGQGMGEMEPDGKYDENYDFSKVSIRKMEALSFNWMPMPMPGQAVFSSAQFGTGLLSNNLMIYGAWGNQDITISLAAGDSSFNASGWQFANSGSTSGTESAVWGHYTYTGTDMGGMYTGMDVGGADTIHLTGSRGNNSITGTSVDDIISGGMGNDMLVGGAGNDTLIGGLGNDNIDGGTGINTANYSYATSAVTVSLALAGAQNTGGAGIDALTHIERLVGSAYNDRLTGSAGDNWISGAAGNDSISGGAGNDGLVGGAGNDSLDGGSDVDAVYYSDATSAVTVSLALAGAQNTGGAGVDILANFERLVGSAYNDRLTGSAGENWIAGAAGNDSISGGTGNDSLVGGAGNDSLDGGTGGDTAYYSDATSAVTVSLALAGAQNTGGAGIDILANIENLVGSAFADGLTGDSRNNLINGLNGDDSISGGAGNDNLSGGEGADTLVGGTGGDALNGGGGNDRFVFQSVNDSTVAARDVIKSFAAGDHIDVSGIDANTGVAFDQAFVLDAAGAAGFATGHIRQTISGADVILEFNVDADATAEMRIVVANHGALSSSDFML